MAKKIPILTFHSIDTSGSVISICPSRFRHLLISLKQQGYQTISLNEVIQWIAGEKSFRSPCVVISFDDGYENLYTHAFPILEELGFQATLFLTTGHCGKENNWLTRPRSIPLLSMLSWQQLKEMAQSVFDIQAHTQNHPFLFKLHPELVNDELLGSKTEIENRLGKQVDFFAYPHGYFNRDEDIPVRQYFKAACTTELDFVHPERDRYLLPRIDMYYFSQLVTSKLFLSPLFDPYLRFRQSLRRLRQ